MQLYWKKIAILIYAYRPQVQKKNFVNYLWTAASASLIIFNQRKKNISSFYKNGTRM